MAISKEERLKMLSETLEHIRVPRTTRELKELLNLSDYPVRYRLGCLEHMNLAFKVARPSTKGGDLWQALAGAVMVEEKPPNLSQIIFQRQAKEKLLTGSEVDEVKTVVPPNRINKMEGLYIPTPHYTRDGSQQAFNLPSRGLSV